MYHDLPIDTGLTKLYKFFIFALSIGFLRASVRIVSVYVLQVGYCGGVTLFADFLNALRVVQEC